MKRILILLALVMLVFLVGCGSYDSAEYAETLIDLELSSEDYDPESTIRLSTERQGYELPDFFAFETELHSNPELVREVNEELVDLAPDPDELAAFYYESLDGREGTPFDDLRDRPELIPDALSSIEASYSSGDTFGFGELEGIFDDNDNEAFYFFSFAALLEDSRLFISAINEHEPTADDYIDYLDDYDINPRSATALGLILRRAYWEDKPDYVVEPLVLYLTELGFELVKPLNTPVPLEKYHELNLYALEQILKGGLTSDEALSKALKRYDLSSDKLNELNQWLSEHPEIQRASQRYLALALDEMTDEYKSEAGLTWHRLEMINEYSNSSAYGYSSNDIDAWHSIADNYNEYLEDLGKVKGLTPENVIKALTAAFNKISGEEYDTTHLVADEDLLQTLSEYDVSAEQLGQYTEDLLTNSQEQSKLLGFAEKQDEDVEQALCAFLARRIGERYLEQLRTVIEKYRDDQTSAISEEQMPFLALIPEDQASSIPSYTPGMELPGFDRTDCTAVEFATGTIASTRMPETTRDTIKFTFNTIEQDKDHYPLVHFFLTYVWYENGEKQVITKPIALVFNKDQGRLVIQRVLEVDEFYLEYFLDSWTIDQITTQEHGTVLDAYRMPRYEDDDHILPEWFKLDGRQEAGEIGEATEEAGEIADAEAEGHYIEVWDGPMNLRDAPTLDSNVLTKVETGERMLFISEGPMDYQADTYAPWIKCRTMDGVTGYMFSYFTTYSDNTWSVAPVLEEAGALEEAAAEAMGY